MTTAIQLPRKHEWQELQPDHGVFVVEPFEPGFALTVGNAFRRVLLSSIEGAAPTWIKIDGVLHEFSFLPGATEDSLDILSSLRRVVFKLHGERSRLIRLRVTGPGVAKASDFQTDHDLVILNPEQPLATLERDVTLEMEVHVEKGRGYVPADKREAETLAVNALAMVGRPYRYTGNTRTVDIHVRRVRSKLGDFGSIIETVRNVGYKMRG